VEKRGCFGFDPTHRRDGILKHLEVSISKEFDAHERVCFVVRSDPMAIWGSFHYMANKGRLVTLRIVFGA